MPSLRCPKIDPTQYRARKPISRRQPSWLTDACFQALLQRNAAGVNMLHFLCDSDSTAAIALCPAARANQAEQQRCMSAWQTHFQSVLALGVFVDVVPEKIVALTVSVLPAYLEIRRDMPEGHPRHIAGNVNCTFLCFPTHHFAPAQSVHRSDCYIRPPPISGPCCT